MAKILSISDSLSKPSGFATVCRNVLFRLVYLGHEVFHLGLQNTDGNKTYDFQYEDMAKSGKFIQNLPTYGHSAAFGKPEFEQHYKEVQPDIIFTVMDLHMCQWLVEYKKKFNFQWICYLPLDGGPIPSYWNQILPHIDLIVVMSKWAEKMLNEAGYSCAYVPHGVNNEIYKPDEKRGLAFRKKHNFPEDAFIYLFLNRNQHRKNIPDLIDAYKIVAADKHDTFLYFHCCLKEDMGWNIPVLLKQAKIINKCAYTTGVNPELGVKLDALIDIYNMADVLVTTTTGEGFGLTTIEALSCGKPVIHTDYTTGKELVEGHGLLVPVDRYVRLIDRTRGVYAGYPDVNKFADAMNLYYNDRELLKDHSEKARKFALGYSWDNIVPIWHALIIALQRQKIGEIRDMLGKININKLEVTK